MIRTLPIEGGKKGHTLLFEDMAEQAWLRSTTPSLSEILLHFCFTQLRAQTDYRLGDRSKTGTVGIIALNHLDEAQSYIASAKSFLKTYQDSCILMIHLGTQRKFIQKRLAVVPVGELV